MTSIIPSLDLVEFVETKILPQYSAFDSAHNLSHVNSVIKRSLALVNTTGADVNMVYVVAAYHDLGMSGPRAMHHILGGRILATDARLRKWFTPDQITIMKEAIEDHRASASRAPRGIYGKIVAEADRDMSPDVVFRRAIQFGLAKYDADETSQWLHFKKHMDEKYSSHGYIRLWINGSKNEALLKEVRAIIADPIKLKAEFNRILAEEKMVERPMGNK